MVQEQPAESTAAPADEHQPQQEEVAKPFSVKEGMQAVIGLLEKSVKTKETRLLMGRLMRQTAMVRRHMTGADLAGFIKTYTPENSPTSALLSKYVEEVTAEPWNKVATTMYGLLFCPLKPARVLCRIRVLRLWMMIQQHQPQLHPAVCCLKWSCTCIWWC